MSGNAENLLTENKMTRLMTTTAIALMIGSSAFAEAHADMEKFEASDLMGARVYTGDPDGMVGEWEDIGEIEDLLVTMSGDVPSAIVGVGGFLGMGEKDVTLPLDRIKVVTDEDGDRFFVVEASQDELKNAEAYVPMDEKREMVEEAEEEKAEVAEEAEEVNDDVTRKTAMAPVIDRDGYTQVEDREALNTEDLTGARVYDINDEDIGEINELLVTDSGKLGDAIIDVGGFLGMGEKQVALPFDSLQLMREDGGDDVRVYVDQSQASLEAMPEYED